MVGQCNRKRERHTQTPRRDYWGRHRARESQTSEMTGGTPRGSITQSEQLLSDFLDLKGFESFVSSLFRVVLLGGLPMSKQRRDSKAEPGPPSPAARNKLGVALPDNYVKIDKLNTALDTLDVNLPFPCVSRVTQSLFLCIFHSPVPDCYVIYGIFLLI